MFVLELSCNTSVSFTQQALVLPEKFQHILRVLNTNIDGKQKVMFALTYIKVSAENYLLLIIIFPQSKLFLLDLLYVLAIQSYHNQLYFDLLHV